MSKRRVLIGVTVAATVLCVAIATRFALREQRPPERPIARPGGTVVYDNRFGNSQGAHDRIRVWAIGIDASDAYGRWGSVVWSATDCTDSVVAGRIRAVAKPGVVTVVISDVRDRGLGHFAIPMCRRPWVYVDRFRLPASPNDPEMKAVVEHGNAVSQVTTQYHANSPSGLNGPRHVPACYRVTVKTTVAVEEHLVRPNCGGSIRDITLHLDGPDTRTAHTRALVAMPDYSAAQPDDCPSTSGATRTVVESRSGLNATGYFAVPCGEFQNPNNGSGLAFAGKVDNSVPVFLLHVVGQ